MRLGSRKLSLSGLIVLMGTLALLLAACGGGGTSGTTGDKLPDSQQIFHPVLNPGSNDIATMDPQITQDLYSIEPVTLVFPSLVTLDNSLKVEPWAINGMPDVSSDGTTYTFHIKPGLKFSDGEPIDANAFAYSINRAVDPCLASPVSYYLANIKDAGTFTGETCNKDGSYSAAKGQTSAVVKTLIGDSLVVQDAQTLVIKLSAPAAYFLEALTYPTSFAVPQNMIKQYGSKWIEHLTDNGGFGGNLYKVTKWDHSGSLDLVRNDAFWGTKPQLKEIDYTIYKDRGTEYNAYLAGQNDRTGIPTTNYQQAKSRNDFHELGALSIGYYAMNWKQAPFDDVRVRQAFAISLDKNSIVNNVLHGAAIATNHIVPQGMPGYNQNLNGPDGTQSLSGDTSKATALATAYAAEKCGGQMSKCPQVTFTITTGSQDLQNEAEAALQMWQKAMPGWPIKIATTDFNTLLNNLAAKQVQFWAIGWGADYPDPQDFLSLQFGPAATNNNGSVSVPDANTLMNKADAETDQNQRIQDYEAAEQLLVTAVAWLPITQSKSFYLSRSYVKNYSITAQLTPSLDQWEQVYIAKH